MDDILRGTSTRALEDLVEALVRAASCGPCWEDEDATPAREAMQRLGLAWIFADWQEAFDTLGMQALEILRVRYRYDIDWPV
jgi:hypothetical protein